MKKSRSTESRSSGCRGRRIAIRWSMRLAWPPSWPMYVPVHATTAAWAAIVLTASRPRRLVELGLVDLPDAARTGQEGERHGATHRQQLGRSYLRHPRCAAAPAAAASRSSASRRRHHAQGYRGSTTSSWRPHSSGQCRLGARPGRPPVGLRPCKLLLLRHLNRGSSMSLDA
jgi:hypothetical protein